jgi:hypothetical protein
LEIEMTNYNKRVWEMLNRVLVFARTRPQLFIDHIEMAQLLQQIEAAVQQLSVDALAERRAVKLLTDSRVEARAGVRNELGAIVRTARGLQLNQFWIPRDNSDRALVQCGLNFAKEAAPIKEVFTAANLPPDFIDTLNSAVQTLQKTIQDHEESKDARKTAAKTLAATQGGALATLQRLSPMVENRVREDAVTLAIWRSARRVARPVKTAATDTQTAPPLIPPVTQAATAPIGT